MATQIFRYPDGVWPNVLALGVTVLGYPLGIALLTAGFWLWNVAGFGLVLLSLVWSAYFIHEFTHHAIFKNGPVNARWAGVMSWINGSCFARFEDMRNKHMRHHVERADVITFDHQAFLLKSPAWVRNTVLALEWAYFPAVEFLMRGFILVMPFQRNAKKDKGRPAWQILAIGLVRGSAWLALGWYSPKALILYFLAYVVFVTVLRFADCFQHTYDAYPIVDNTPIPADKVRDRAYEQANTFSDIVGLSHPLLNLFWLNFGYHNAHHERPTMPWYRLPSYHREVFASDYAQVVTVGELLRSFHVNRVKRILADDYGEVLQAGIPRRADGFVGAVGVSFLTAI